MSMVSKVIMLEKDLYMDHGEDLKDVLLPRLHGRVFHVTTLSAYASIISDRAIKSNQDAQYPFTYGQSKNSFFRNRGCVSFFDLREVSPEQMQETLGKYYFLNPPFTEGRPIYLFLNSLCFPQLLSWSLWKKQEAYREMVIPYVEAGFPDQVPLSLVDEVLRVNIGCDNANDERRKRNIC